MSLSRLFVLLALIATPAVATADAVPITREQVSGDVYHYTFTFRVGETANARLRVHRVVRESAPWMPRPTVAGAMLLHGDFATFPTNFGAMATYLARDGIDVWGADRRWTTTPVDGDTSDFAEMGFAQELDDIGKALAFARAMRFFTGSGPGKLSLVGFSRGGQLAYAYAAGESARPVAQRHVRTLVPLDVYAVVPPELDQLRQEFFCAGSQFEYELVAMGYIDAENSFVIGLGAPENRARMLKFAGLTYRLFPATPWYHLAAPVLGEAGEVVGLRESNEDDVAAWFGGAPPHQSMVESADGDALWCGEGALPVPYDLSEIVVPLFNLAAAGGFGDTTVYSTTRVGSREVASLVVRRGVALEEEIGHGDLLFGADAPELVWRPLATWIRNHR